MTTARKLMAGAAWSYGAQFLTVVAQFAYAAITSRALGADGFGAYSVALAASGLVSLLAMSGLGQSMSRMVVLDKSRIRALVSYSLILGLAAGALLLFVAPLWAQLWGVEEATEPIRWLAVSTSLSPLFGLATGLMARSGKFRSLAIVTLCSNLAGMFLGAAAVLAWKTSSSLIVSAAIAQMLTLICALLLTDKLLFGLAPLRHGHAEIGYSGRLASTGFLSYITGNLLKFSMTKGISADSLGYWNRAEVLTLVPMQQVQGAIIRAVSPEFRHDIGVSTRARVVWTDMLILVSWASFSLAAVACVAVPPIVPVLFGSGWEIAASITGPLAVVGAFQILSTLLATAVEALGRFRWIVMTELLLITVQVIGAIFVFFLHDIWIAVVTLIVTNVVRHGWHVWLLGRSGYLNVSRLMRNYAASAAFATFLAVWIWYALQVLTSDDQVSLLWLFVVMICVVGVGVRLRNRVPVVVIAQKYGLFGERP